MVDINSIHNTFDGLVGFKQPTNPDYAIVSLDNQATSSGRYFSDMCGLVTIKNIKVTQNYPSISDDDFNSLLVSMKNNSLTKVMGSLFYNNDLINNDKLFSYEYDFTNTIDNDSSFVGYSIDVAKNKNFKSIINSVSMTFDGDGVVKLLLFHSSKKEPVKSKEITVEQDNEVTSLLNWSLDYAHGTYYIGYLTDGLTIKSYNRQYDESNLMNQFSICRFDKVKVSGHTTETLFDVNDVSYRDETYGLNFDVSEYRDYTSLVNSNATRFINAWILQFSNDVLEQIIHTTRSNGTERNLVADAAFELNGSLNNPELPNTTGIANKLTKELNELASLLSPLLLTLQTLK